MLEVHHADTSGKPNEDWQKNDFTRNGILSNLPHVAPGPKRDCGLARRRLTLRFSRRLRSASIGTAAAARASPDQPGPGGASTFALCCGPVNALGARCGCRRDRIGGRFVGRAAVNIFQSVHGASPMEFGSAVFWIAVLQIIAIDIVLGGDNAVVIGLASRRLPLQQRNKAIFWGVFGAVGMRVVLIFFALQLLQIPYLKIIGGALLLWIGVKLLMPQDEGGHKIDASTHLFGAIKTIVVADAVMSFDNVIAIAAAAKDSLALVVFGLVVSVPIIVWGSKFVLMLMDRFPIVIVGGAALLGWIGGDMLAKDVVLKDWVDENAAWLKYAAPMAGAAFVVLAGKMFVARFAPTRPAADLAMPSAKSD
jgi:YjbE family integral membrane protein